MKGSGWRNSGTLWRSTQVHTLKTASPVNSKWVGELVGFGSRIPVCVSLVPVCGRRGVDILSIELRAENNQGSLPVPGAVGELEEQST